MNPIGKIILEYCDNELRFDLKAHMDMIRKQFEVSTFTVELYANKIGVSIVGRYYTVMNMLAVVPPVSA